VLEDRIRGVAEDELENAGENDVVTRAPLSIFSMLGFPVLRKRRFVMDSITRAWDGFAAEGRLFSK
jgi:hypothetical protein